MLKLLKQGVGLALLTDGVSALIAPRSYLRQLQDGIPLIDSLLEFGAENPQVTRGLSVAEILLGAWLLIG